MDWFARIALIVTGFTAVLNLDRTILSIQLSGVYRRTITSKWSKGC
jgi:hypothetical protein